MMAGLATTSRALAAGAREAPAELAGLNAARLAQVDSTIEAAIRNGATPGAALAIGRHGQIVRLRGYGRLTYAADAAAVTDSTIFDLASLTKVVGTTSAIMKLVGEGRLHLDVPIFQYLPMWPREGNAGAITLRHLLTHTSGLPAGADLWTNAGREARISSIAKMRLVSPPGTQTIYSDLGMVLAGAVVESVTGERLDDYLQREVFAPLEMNETLYKPSLKQAPVADAIVVDAYDRSNFFEPFSLVALWSEAAGVLRPLFSVQKDEAGFDAARIAPTEGGLRARVHDPIARSLDGVAGNAGLFSSARDLSLFAQAILEASKYDVDAPFVSAAVVHEFTQRQDNGRALGWDMPAGRSSAGDYFSSASFGHTGYTGTSIWIDPERDLFVVLLTNRVYPTAANQKHIALRRAVHDEVELAVEDVQIAAR